VAARARILGIRLALDHVHADVAVTELERRLERLDEPGSVLGLERDAVLNDLDLALAPRVHSRIALAREKGLDLVPREARRHFDRERHEHARRSTADVGVTRELLVDRLRIVPTHLAPAAPAEEAGRASVEQLHVIVDLGHRADRRARGPHRVRLVDRDGRRNTFDALDLRLVHTVQELARIRRERFDVAPLPLGVDGVEGERGLARAADARNHDELVERQIEVDVAQIVLARAANADHVMSHLDGFGDDRRHLARGVSSLCRKA